jgi:hypothetical protein
MAGTAACSPKRTVFFTIVSSFSALHHHKAKQGAKPCFDA